MAHSVKDQDKLRYLPRSQYLPEQTRTINFTAGCSSAFCLHIEKLKTAEVEGAADAKIGSLFPDDGGQIYLRTTHGTVEPVEVPAPTAPRIKGQISLRGTLRALLDLARSEAPTSQIDTARRLLNVKYDSYVAKYGPLSSRTNLAAFYVNPDAPLGSVPWAGLDSQKETAAKSDVLLKRVLEPIDLRVSTRQ